MIATQNRIGIKAFDRIDNIGKTQIIATDSKNNPLTNVRVYGNNVFNGSVDADGSRAVNYTNVVCGSSQTIEIRCSDNTMCDSKSSSIDNNGDYDSLSFTCNICINKTDLSIKTSDVSIKSNGSKYNISALINVEKVTASNVKIDFRGQSAKDSSITQNETKTINVNQYVNQNVSVLWDLNKTDFVSITVDFNNIVAEIDESNNYIKKSTRPLTKAYVDISADYPVLITAYNNFLDDYIDLVTEANAEVKIYIGRKNGNIPKETEQKADNQRWMLTGNLVQFNSKKEGLPYNGLAVKQNNNIYVIGNEIDGELAALRKIVDNQEFYFSKSVTERIDYISEEDLDGLFVFDYLHTDENQPKYRQNTANFATVVSNVLNSNIYSLAIKGVLTSNDNTSLRLKNINAELSPKFREFSNPQPVVLARGLWPNLFSWERFGRELAEGVRNGKPQDIWLIEITGGLNTECANCPNYNYNDLRDYYWPALLAGVQKYSNKADLTYVIDFRGQNLKGSVTQNESKTAFPRILEVTE